MNEITINLHMHTYYSDGHASHAQIAEAALRLGLDVVIVTDHNVWVNGPEGYYQDGERRTLLLVGEEVHDPARLPQKSHLLVFGANRELATYASNPQNLIDTARRYGGLAFLAHPMDPPAPAVNQDDLSWDDWQVAGYTGIELWNGFSEFKSLLKSKLHALYYIFNPARIGRGPLPEMLQKWDELLAVGQRVAAIGGSDAHAMPIRLGPITRIVFPFDYHFAAVNTHLILPSALSGDLGEDRRLIYDALKKGSGFVGYDLPASTRGFRFSAQGKTNTAWMGDEISAQNGVTMQVRMPQKVEGRLIRDGKLVSQWNQRETYVYITTEPGAYRVEAYINYLGKRRGWIFSNPIYVTK